MKSAGKTCDIVNTKEEYRKRYQDIDSSFDVDSLSYRYKNYDGNSFWKVLLPNVYERKIKHREFSFLARIIKNISD